jgi:hypothetical protein
MLSGPFAELTELAMAYDFAPDVIALTEALNG